MIRFTGEKDKPVSFVTYRKLGHPMKVLTEQSDPKELYAALYEFACKLNQIHTENNLSKI